MINTAEVINDMIDPRYRKRFEVKERKYSMNLMDKNWVLIQWTKGLILRYLYEWGFMKEEFQKVYDLKYNK